MTAGQRSSEAASAPLRARILEAARALLAERGLDADVQDVIARAGVGAGSLYRAFASKEALFRVVAMEMIDRTRREFLEIASTHRDARTCVALTMELGFRNVADYGQLAIEVYCGIHPPEYGDLFDRSALEAFFRALVERGVHQGHFDPDTDVEHAVGVWFALTAPNVLGRMLSQRSVEEVARSTTRFFLTGLGARPPS